MLFDKTLFESKYVEPAKRVPIDTLFLIGNGFDIWQGLDTRYAAFEKYYEKHLDEILSRLHLKKKKLTDKAGTIITCSDVELFYGNPYEPQKLPHMFWNDFETSLDKIDDQEINSFFGRDGVKNIQNCANNAQKILKEIFCDWVTSIEIEPMDSKYDFGTNALFINFNYTDTLLKRFGVTKSSEFHIHGSADDKNSIIVGHSTHPELPYEALRAWRDKPRLQGLYYIEEFLYNTDKHVEDNYMKLRIFCALHGIGIEDIKHIYSLGLGFGNADLGYIKHFVHTTEGIHEKPESDLDEEELDYLNSLSADDEKFFHLKYAGSHRERVMKKAPISFPDLEIADLLIEPFLDDPYYHITRSDQMKLETAVVRRKFWREQKERDSKIQKEYLRMLNKSFHTGYLSLTDACLEPTEDTLKNLSGAKWHISYFSDDDKKKIESVMAGYGCKNYTLHASIDDCIKSFQKNSSK